MEINGDQARSSWKRKVTFLREHKDRPDKDHTITQPKPNTKHVSEEKALEFQLKQPASNFPANLHLHGGKKND